MHRHYRRIREKYSTNLKTILYASPGGGVKLIVDLWKLKHRMKRSIQLEIHIRFAFMGKSQNMPQHAAGASSLAIPSLVFNLA